MTSHWIWNILQLFYCHKFLIFILIFIIIKMWFFFSSVTKKLVFCCQNTKNSQNFSYAQGINAQQHNPVTGKTKLNEFCECSASGRKIPQQREQLPWVTFFPFSINITNYSKMSLYASVVVFIRLNMTAKKKKERNKKKACKTSRLQEQESFLNTAKYLLRTRSLSVLK